LTDLPALVAPDSFKGTFSASEVAAAIARGLRAAGREAEELPVADGGEGTLDALMSTLDGELRSARVSDPLGRPIDAEFALIDGGATAIVEMARASGLGLVADDERDAWAASTRGTGELIVAAAEAGAPRASPAVAGGVPPRFARGTWSAPTGSAARSGRRSASGCAAPARSPSASACSSARRCGSGSAGGGT